MSPIDKLTQLFEKFPGIGPKQARRFVQYLLMVSPAIRGEISEQIKALGAATAQCKRCFRWFPIRKQASNGAGTCDICSDESRNASLLFVIEKDADIDNVERSGYRGLYFVLGGTIPLGSEEQTKHVRLPQLQARAQEGMTQEVILGLSATTEGDHTRQILAEKLQKPNIKISSLGRGLSTGSELEYADPDTIAEALGNRH